MKIGHTGTDLFNFSSEIMLKASRDAKIIKSCMDSYTKNLQADSFNIMPFTQLLKNTIKKNKNDAFNLLKTILKKIGIITKALQAKSIFLTNIKPFCQLLKDKRKKTKNDSFNLPKPISTNIGMTNQFSDRTVKHANSFFNDLFLVYVSIKHPQKLLNIRNSFFVNFPFRTKFDNKILDIS